MNCATAREALSARLDGEATGLDVAVEAHLATCAACVTYAAGIDRLHRAVRLAPAEAVPDLTVDILRRSGGVRRLPQVDAARVSLALLAVLQVVVTFLSHDGGHGGRDSAVWELALAGAFAWAAWRPRRSEGLLPVLGAVALLQLANAAADLARGATGISQHLTAAVGWYLLTQLHGRAVLSRRRGSVTA